MQLDFHPALGSQTTVHVPELGDAHHRFTASFASRDALEQARAQGVRVEMWTNLPVGANNGDWHALAFEYPSQLNAEKPAAASLTLGPDADSDAQSAEDKDVYLDVVVRNTLCGARFSFTYRLVWPDGNVQWLGRYGQNGDIVLERQEERFALAEGCSYKDGLVVRTGDASEDTPVARLSQGVNWVCWALHHEGWTTHTLKPFAPRSRAVVLVPQLPRNIGSSLILQPLFLGVQEASGSAVSISSTGEVFIHNTSVIAIRDTSATSLEEALSTLSGFAATIREDGYCVVRTQAPVNGSSPTSVSIIPTTCTASVKGTKLTYDDLCSFSPQVKETDTVIVDLTRPTFVELDPSSLEEFSIAVGPYGGHFVVTPMHILKQAEEELPWGLALLSPSSSAQVETYVSDELGGLLPTPPPSPPPSSLPLVSSTSVTAITPRPAVNGMSITLPSLTEVAKKLEPIAPPTPLSPPARSEPTFEEESENEFEEEPKEFTASPSHLTFSPSRSQQPIRGGFLRFFFAWLFRTMIARVCGFFGHALRIWGLPQPGFLFLHESFGSESGSEADPLDLKVEPVPETKETQSPVEDVKEQKVDEYDENHLNASESVIPAPSPSATTLADNDDVADKDDFSSDEKLDITSSDSVETVVSALEPPVYVSPHAPTKTRFLADVHSNTVSLLVRAPHARRSASDLQITMDGKKVSDESEYTCSQLFENVYLLGLPGPSEGGRLEISVD